MTTKALRAALEALVTLHLDESPRLPGSDADAWADAWEQARAALAQPSTERKPLTEEEIRTIARETPGQQGGWNMTFARAIERAVRGQR